MIVKTIVYLRQYLASFEQVLLLNQQIALIFVFQFNCSSLTVVQEA
jgi:hypothetical protein